MRDEMRERECLTHFSLNQLGKDKDTLTVVRDARVHQPSLYLTISFARVPY